MTPTLELSLGPSLTEQQAREIFSQGEEAVIFSLLALAKQLAEQAAAAAGTSHETPATPSGMKPAYKKPNAPKRKKKPGRKAGHAGSRRPLPKEIDHRKTHWLWCFANRSETYFMIDRSRGSPALLKFFTDVFEGTLVTDFWAPTMPWSARGARRAWSICSASWNTPRNTSRRANIGRSLSRNFVGCCATASVCGTPATSTTKRHSLRGASV